MKKILLLLLLIPCFQGVAQQTDEIEIKNVISMFFNSLESQDTVLLRKSAFPEGQIWSLNNTQTQPTHTMRTVEDDIKSFPNENEFLEIPLSYDIRVHEGLAVAWVPYEFKLNGEFSHCGVDIFTLVKAGFTWKIANISYTVDKENCDELKKMR